MTGQRVTVLDVGGTHLRWAAWSPEAGLSKVRRLQSPSVHRYPHATVAELRSRLVEIMADCVPRRGIAGVSFGAALNHRTGSVYASAPLWGEHTDLFDLMSALRCARPDVRWHVINDVTAAALHLAASPLAEHRRKLMVMTVSTGIACRTIDRRSGHIPLDGCGLQGEIGHLPATLTIDGAPVDAVCDCGQSRHVAAFSSGPALRRLADVLRSRRPQEWSASVFGERLSAGESFESAFARGLETKDPCAVDLLSAATAPVADVVRMALCLDPGLDLVAVTGGVATALRDDYRAALLGHLRREGLYLTSDRAPDWVTDRIYVCSPGEANGLIGAGLAALAANSHASGVSRPARVCGNSGGGSVG